MWLRQNDYGLITSNQSYSRAMWSLNYSQALRAKPSCTCKQATTKFNTHTHAHTVLYTLQESDFYHIILVHLVILNAHKPNFVHSQVNGLSSD